jgi:glycosyltransferase involved in cell wall biosynthesis
MSRILIYYSANKRSNSIETYALQLRACGNEVYFMTTCNSGDLHDFFKINGFTFADSKSGERSFPLAFIIRFIELLRFCYRYKIDIIHSHLHPTNIVAVFAQYFLKSKVVVFRHHLHHVLPGQESSMINRNERMFDKVISRMARMIVIPSNGVYNGMVNDEGVNSAKLMVIPYIYDFAQYNKPNPSAVSEIKSKYPCQLRLIMVSRLIKLKRHMAVFPVIKKLIEVGLDLKLIVLDEGDEKENLQDWIVDNGMQNHIILVGYRRDFINYMAASDMLLQPSLTDASNNVAKEMAMLEKVIAVSEGVGDYSDYVEDGVNGFLLPLANTESKIEDCIRKVYDDPGHCKEMGQRLRNTVLGKFDVSNSGWVMDLYNQLHTRL